MHCLVLPFWDFIRLKALSSNHMYLVMDCVGETCCAQDRWILKECLSVLKENKE
jgi:hypothetical protein